MLTRELAALWNFIQSNVSLLVASVTAYFEVPQSLVLGTPTLHSSAPHAEWRGLHFSSHEFDHLRLRKPKLQRYCIKRRTILPSHFHDAVNGSLVQFWSGLWTFFLRWCWFRHMHKKPHLPEKVCPVCERPFTWRKKWEKNWDEVKYCSERCRRNK